MKIWIDGKEANQPNRVGSGQYAFEVIRNLEKIDSDNEYTILLPGKPLDDLPKPRKNWTYRILRPGRLWTRIALPASLYLSKDKPDLIFSPTHYIPRFSPVRRVCTIFDLAFLHFPEFFEKKDLWQLKNWTKFSLDNADKIFVISDFTRADLIKNYEVSTEKIIVTHLGFDDQTFKPVRDRKKIEEVLKKYQIRKPFILYIGTIQPRKNLVRLMEAFSRISDLDSNLVIVGKTNEEGRKGWLYKDILKTPKQLGIEERINFAGFVPTKDLPYILSGAIAFVLPSLWEGFGIPVLEAMATGAPVIVSNVSSLPEVAGKAGIYIDPYSEDQIEQALRLVLTDQKLRLGKSKMSLEQARKFSWEKCAGEVLETLLSLKAS